LVPVALRHFEEGDPREHPGIVDQHVDRTELFLGGRHHHLHLLYLAHVSLDQDGAPSARTYLISHTLGGSFVIEPVDRNVGTGGSKLQRHRAANPLLRPRDQNRFARELHAQIP